MFPCIYIYTWSSGPGLSSLVVILVFDFPHQAGGRAHFRLKEYLVWAHYSHLVTQRSNCCSVISCCGRSLSEWECSVCSSRADVLLLFISRTNSRTLRQSSTSSSSSSQPPCSQSAWQHFSSITAGLSVRTGRLWVSVYCLFSGFGRSLVNVVMAVLRFHAHPICVFSQRPCARRCLAMVQIRMASAWAPARTCSKFLVMRANTGLSPCSPGKENLLRDTEHSP